MTINRRDFVAGCTAAAGGLWAAGQDRPAAGPSPTVHLDRLTSREWPGR